MGVKRLFNSLLGGTHYRLVNKDDYDRIFACKDAGVSAADGVGRSVIDDLQKIVGPKPGVIFDVGANKGATYRMFRSIFPRSPIYAFEPDPRAFATLKAKAEGDAEAHLSPLAISDQIGEVEFNVMDASELNSLLPATQASEIAGTVTTREKIKVQSDTLDAFTARAGISRVDLLKMDIQGAEIRALEGARTLLGRRAIGCLYLELSFYETYQGAPLATDVIAYLHARSYRLACLYNLQYAEGSAVLLYCDGLFVPHSG
jgi:FkbM family methyltransferase